MQTGKSLKFCRSRPQISHPKGKTKTGSLEIVLGDNNTGIKLYTSIVYFFLKSKFYNTCIKKIEIKNFGIIFDNK